jgi:GntR family transcriptional regulator
MSQLLPFYYQIKQIIKTRIINRELSPREKIPSENKLADHFKVTRVTVRQAIQLLVQEGLLIKRRGKGTFVTANEHLIESLSYESAGFIDENFYDVQKPKTKSVEIDSVIVPKFVNDKLELDESDEKVVQLKRVRCLKNNYFNYIINYLPVAIGTKLAKEDLYKKSLMKILENEMGIEFTEAFQTIEASFASQEVAQKLKIPSGSPVLEVVKTMYTKKRKPVALSQILYRGDLFKYIARFRKVKRKKGHIWVRSSL